MATFKNLQEHNVITIWRLCQVSMT